MSGGQPGIDPHGNHLSQAAPVPIQKLSRRRPIPAAGPAEQCVGVWLVLGHHPRPLLP